MQPMDLEGSALTAEVEELSPVAPVNMARDWFDLVDETHFWMQWRARVVVALARQAGVPPGPLLEVGCGSGVFRAQAETQLGVPIDGCDLDLEALRSARKGAGRLLLYNVFDRIAAMRERYDGLILMDVLEHTDDDRAFLAASLHCVRSQSLVLVNVPASPRLYSRYDVVAGHQRRYTRSTLASLLESCNVQVLKVAPWGLSLVPLLAVRKVALRFVRDEDVIRVGFAPPADWTATVLGLLMRMETNLSTAMPYGASLAAVGRYLGS